MRKIEIYINLIGELLKPLAAGSFRYTFNPNNTVQNFEKLWRDIVLEVPGWVDMKIYKEDLNRKAYFAYIIASGPQKGPQPISAAVPNIPNRTMKDWMKLMDSIEKENKGVQLKWVVVIPVQFASDATASSSENDDNNTLLHPPERASVLKKRKSNESIAIHTKIFTNQRKSKSKGKTVIKKEITKEIKQIKKEPPKEPSKQDVSTNSNKSIEKIDLYDSDYASKELAEHTKGVNNDDDDYDDDKEVEEEEEDDDDEFPAIDLKPLRKSARLNTGQHDQE